MPVVRKTPEFEKIEQMARELPAPLSWFMPDPYDPSSYLHPIAPILGTMSREAILALGKGVKPRATQDLIGRWFYGAGPNLPKVTPDVIDKVRSMAMTLGNILQTNPQEPVIALRKGIADSIKRARWSSQNRGWKVDPLTKETAAAMIRHLDVHAPEQLSRLLMPEPLQQLKQWSDIVLEQYLKGGK